MPKQNRKISQYNTNNNDTALPRQQNSVNAVSLDRNRLSDAGISHCANCISVLSDYLDYHTIDAYSLLLYHQAAANEKTCPATKETTIGKTE